MSNPFREFEGHNFDLDKKHILWPNKIITANLRLKEQRKLKAELNSSNGLKDALIDTGISFGLAIVLTSLNRIGLNPFEVATSFDISALAMALLAIRRLRLASPKIKRYKHLKSR